MQFFKYHALGNDYIVIDPSLNSIDLTQDNIKLLCHRNFGIGSDGILLGPLKTDNADFALRIFNPDGSEAEKSGNGLRIFSRYLWDKKLVSEKMFSIFTKGGIVESTVNNKGRSISVNMGKVTFKSSQIPVIGIDREVINEPIKINDTKLKFCAASIGNPHCVIVSDKISSEQAKTMGPVIENDDRFPNKINVQFMKIIDRNNIAIEIWERGAGYTLASGSSSSAAAAVAYKLGLCDSSIMVHMPGGKIDIEISDDIEINMKGPVTKVAEGKFSSEIFY